MCTMYNNMPSILEFSNPVPLYFNRFQLKPKYDMKKTFFSDNSIYFNLNIKIKFFHSKICKRMRRIGIFYSK